MTKKDYTRAHQKIVVVYVLFFGHHLDVKKLVSTSRVASFS